MRQDASPTGEDAGSLRRRVPAAHALASRTGDRSERVDRPMPRATRRRTRWLEPVSRVATALVAAPPPSRHETLDEPCFALVVDVPDTDEGAARAAEAEEPCYALVVDVPDDDEDGGADGAGTGGRVVPFVPRTGAGRPRDGRSRPAPARPTGARPHRPDTDHRIRPDRPAVAHGGRPPAAAPDLDAGLDAHLDGHLDGGLDGAAPPAPATPFDQDGAGSAEPGTPRPAVDPRIRARRIAIRRAEGRRRLKVLVATLAAVTLVVVVVAAAHLLGSGPAPAAAPHAATAGWVSVPAPGGGNGKAGSPTVAVVDETGRVVQRALVPPAGLPQLVGVTLRGGDAARIRPAALARVAQGLPADLRARAATLQLHQGLVTLGLDQGPEIRLGTPDGLALKGRTASAILAALTTRVHYIDVQVPSAPVTG